MRLSNSPFVLPGVPESQIPIPSVFERDIKKPWTSRNQIIIKCMFFQIRLLFQIWKKMWSTTTTKKKNYVWTTIVDLDENILTVRLSKVIDGISVLWRNLFLKNGGFNSFIIEISVIFVAYTRMLRALLNMSRRERPTKQQPYGHQPPIMKTIQISRTRHAGHCWSRRDELKSDVFLWTSSHGQAKQGDQLESTYNGYVRIQAVAQRTCRKWWTIGRSGGRGSGISMLMTWKKKKLINIVHTWWKLKEIIQYTNSIAFDNKREIIRKHFSEWNTAPISEYILWNLM